MVVVYFFILLWYGFDLCVFEARENVFTKVFLVFYDKRSSPLEQSHIADE